ncbi:MAG: carnitine 3-dehydrogenase [Rhodobacterales bacterium]
MTKTAAIIGGGVIGGGWLARFLLNGWDVNVFDPDPEAERKIGEVLANARRSLPMLYDVALPTEGRLTFCDTLEAAVKNAAWVQESVPERLDVKHKVFVQIETYAPEGAIFGSSTSGFKPSELQEGMNRPDALMVTHPFNPVYLLPLIEVVPSPKTGAETVAKAKQILTSLGMYPLHVRKEIDAHIADRFLEAVWREGLWLIKDGIATTQEIDDAIRYGFGLRWAQMGLFETYRIAGGEAGMKHFIAQFGPCLKWPWTKLMDVPELTPELTDMIADQSDAQSGNLSIRELERLRDDNLVAMMRALKGQDSAAGALINAHQAQIAPNIAPDFSKPIRSADRMIPVDWTDYNGHMNESRYAEAFSEAVDFVMASIGADAAYIARGFSYFTVDLSCRYLAEAHAGQRITIESQIMLGEGKKLKVHHRMFADDGTLLAAGDHFMLHVSLKTRRSCDPEPHVLERLLKAAKAQATLPDPREKRG